MLGRPLYRQALAPDREAKLLAQLDTATRDFQRNPGNPDALIWVGRRLAYLGRYREAITAFTRGVGLHPDDPRFYRHRGHRYITCRQFDLAVADLQLAARLMEGRPDQVEPDGQPNAAGVPLSTLHGNIVYHLALAHFLRREYPEAAAQWRRALDLARNDDTRAAATYWLYLTYRRLGLVREAAELLLPMGPDVQIIENRPYYDLLTLFRGEVAPETLVENARSSGQLATYSYGIASWYQFNRDTAPAESLLREIIAGSDWAAFGYIAAEADLERTDTGL